MACQALKIRFQTEPAKIDRPNLAKSRSEFLQKALKFFEALRRNVCKERTRSIWPDLQEQLLFLVVVLADLQQEQALDTLLLEIGNVDKIFDIIDSRLTTDRLQGGITKFDGQN